MNTKEDFLMSETDKTETKEKQSRSKELIGIFFAIGAIVLIFMVCIVLKDRGNRKTKISDSGEIMGIEQDEKNKKEITAATETPETYRRTMVFCGRAYRRYSSFS